MELVFCSYSDINYRANQERQRKIVEEIGEFDDIFNYTREWLITTDFYNNNKDLLDRERLAGYALWKPYIIMQTLLKMSRNDVLIYMDCGDYPLKGIRKFIQDSIIGHDEILIHANCLLNRQYTKRDCFYYMDADIPKYHDAIQLEDGVIIFKKTKRILHITQLWQKYCSDKRIVSDEPNTCGLPNFPEFIDHRHDQSVLSILQIYHNMNVNNNLRNFVAINEFFHIEGVSATNGMAKWDIMGNRIKE